MNRDYKHRTDSERLFLAYAELRNYDVKRIGSPDDGGRFADYEVFIGNNRIIAEIKELQPNPDDVREVDAVQQRRAEVIGHEPGRRVRTHIEDAERQLRRYENQRIPCLVVLYDNIVVNGVRLHPDRMHVSSYEIDVGMYGLQAANVRLHADGRTESLGDTRGGQRTLRHEHRDNVSAVAVLNDYAPEHGLFLMIYHNYYARTPLPKSIFSHPKDFHLRKPDHSEVTPGGWEKA